MTHRRQHRGFRVKDISWEAGAEAVFQAEVAAVSSERLTLLARKHGGGNFREEDQTRLDFLNARIQQLLPRVRPEDLRELERLELKLDQMEETVHKIRRKYGLSETG